MSDRDPMDIAADEAADVLTGWKNSGLPWSGYLDQLASEDAEASRRYQLAVRIGSTFAAADGSFQQPLLPDDIREPAKPRAPRRVMMHADETRAMFTCPKCGWVTGVVDGTKDAAIKRGIPCPRCNPTEAQS